MRKRAIDAGALQVFANTEVLNLETEEVPFGRPHITAVVTDKGRIEADYVVVACGVWSPRIAAMAGATIPLTPAVHQMADVGPFDILAGDEQRNRLPNCPRYGHILLRTPVRWLHGGRLLRSPPDPHAAG
ncbi:MAG: FAD-dependent oxidoreductase [Acidimicrobiales bacterium]